MTVFRILLLSASMLVRKSEILTCVMSDAVLSHALPLLVPSYDTLSLCFHSQACLGVPNSIREYVREYVGIR